jgi:hypothetical protein
MRTPTLLSVLIPLVLSAGATAQTNVALSAPAAVTAGAANGPLGSLTDGLFLERSQQWQTNTVWWSGLSTAIEVDLGGSFLIDSAIVQADDNDAYLLQYRAPNSTTWLTLWDVPNYDAFGFGMQTRPDPENNLTRFMLPAPVQATALRFTAVSGDDAYSVSEIQVFLVPTPGGAALLGLGGLLAFRRRRAQA